MKRTLLAAILTMLIQTGHGQEGIPYESIHKAMIFIKSKTIDGTKHAPFYIKSEKKVDFKKANFRLEAKDGKRFKISSNILKNISVSELSHEDIEHLTNKFQIRIWIPKNLKKFRGYLNQVIVGTIIQNINIFMIIILITLQLSFRCQK